MDMNLIAYAIQSSWDTDTAYSSANVSFVNNNPSAGQCAVSAAVLNDYIGGTIKKGTINGAIRHYWNHVNETDIDLTVGQFEGSIQVTDIKLVDKQALLRDSNFYHRYIKLKTRVEDFLKRYSTIEKEIANCCLCAECVEKFKSSTIYFGSRKDILLVGEAPANNGWHISGKVWKSSSGKIIPSGKRMKDLLVICEVDLFDCSFVEAVKCHPIERRNLPMCVRNCRTFLLNQIELLAPRIIVTLGKVPTQILISKQVDFDQLVGCIHTVSLGEKEYMVFPIYHPSPISPKSLKNNIPLMLNLKALLKEQEYV